MAYNECVDHLYLYESPEEGVYPPLEFGSSIAHISRVLTLVGCDEGFLVPRWSRGRRRPQRKMSLHGRNHGQFNEIRRQQKKSVFSFPNPVNDVAARIVAGMVVVMSLAIMLTGQSWLMFVLAYGFLARVATGPNLSPAALLATRVAVPLLGNPQRPVPGPPKRFAQSVGLAFSAAALVIYFAAGWGVAAMSVLGVLTVFATLEAALGFCAGCFVFNHLMRWGLIPESVCRECVARS